MTFRKNTISRRVPALALLAALTVVLAGPEAVRADVSRSQETKARAFALLSDGIAAYRKGEAKKAIDLLTQVTNVALNSFRAFYYLGLAYKLDRQFLKAIDPITFALELDPTNMQAHVDLGDCYLQRGDTEEALAEYHRALAVQQSFAPGWDGLARAAEATGDDDKAVEDFKKAIELNPGFPDASLNLGDLYLRRDRLDEAVELFLKAIAVRPDFAAAHNRLGVAYARQKLVNEAIAALRKAAELERGNPWHPYTIGVIEMDFDSLSQAGRDLDEALALDENYLEAYVAKARLFRRLGDFDAAVKMLDTALERPSEDEKLKRDIAEMRTRYLAEGERVRALAAKADSSSATPEELKDLAALRAGSGDYAGAAAALRAARAGAADPNAAPTPADDFLFGYDLLRAGLFEEAEAIFRGLRTSSPGSLPVLVNLGLSLQGQGRNAAAEEIFDAAVRLAPKETTALLALGNARVLNGKWEDAIEAYERALASSDAFEGRARAETIVKTLKARVSPAAPEKADGGTP